jgi:hypothetical protein
LPLRPIQLPIPWIPEALSPGVKWPGCEADHLPSSSTKVKNAWSCTSTPSYVFMAWCLVTGYVFMVWYLVKPRDNFTIFVKNDIKINRFAKNH